MLQRGIVLTSTTLHLKQRLLLRHALLNIHCASKSMFYCKLQSNQRTFLLEPLYLSKGSQKRSKASDSGKGIDENPTAAAITETPVIAKTTRRAKLAAGKPKTLATTDETLSKALQITNTIPPPSTVAPNIELRKYELKTKQGVLSITTTIEDSKINDVVFEKTKPSKEHKIDGKDEDITVTTTTTVVAAKPKTQLNLENLTQKPAPLLLAEDLDECSEEKPKKTRMTITKTNAGKTVTVEDEEQEEDDKEKRPPPAPKEKPSRSASKQAATTTATETKPKPKRSRVDFNRSSLERNFITPARAIEDFLLKPKDLESLTKIKRRSPYEQEPPITVFWRKDVEAKAIEVWGSRENLIKESLKREVDRKKHQQNIFTVKRRLREYRREIGYRAKHFEDEELGLKGKSGKVVLIAIGINGLNFIFKLCAWLYCGSHSMFAEAIHSLADTTNQLILAYGIHKSVQMADHDHPYGYSNMRHVSSLISGVGIFCVGCGLSMYHGIYGLLHPEPVQDLFWAYCILGGSLVSEGATLLVAVNKLRRSAKRESVTLKEYILSGKDPCVNVVLTEDAAAVASVVLAASFMGLTSISGNPTFDAIGSLLVGSILGGVASFIIYTNSSALVGKSISDETLEQINMELEGDCMIRAIYDVKGIHMGNSLIRYKAELDFDGRELTRCYLDKQDMAELYKVVKSFQSVEELEQFILKHGENIVDLLGGEIDRIELKLRSKFPEIRHCDLEVL